MMNQFVNPVNRPFWPGPLPNSQQRGRGQSFLFARGRRGKQLLSMLVSSAESENTQPTKSSSHTSSELNFNESGGNYNSANWGNVEERCNKISPFQHKKSVFKFNIYTPKKGLRYHPVINVKKLNKPIPYIHFKMKDLFLMKEKLLKGDFMCNTNLKDIYFSVPANPKLQKFVTF